MCREYGCPGFQEKEGYCLDHWKPRYQRQESRSDQRYHSKRWQKLRAVFLRLHPICEICGRVAATIPHHVEYVEDGGEFWDMDNLMAVCRNCHEKEHGR